MPETPAQRYRRLASDVFLEARFMSSNKDRVALEEMAAQYEFMARWRKTRKRREPQAGRQSGTVRELGIRRHW